MSADPVVVDRESQRAYYLARARDLHGSDELEIDDDAKLSDSNDAAEGGCFVQAWVWVTDPPCQHCDDTLAPAALGTWVDQTGSDGCHASVHEPPALHDDEETR